MGVCTNGVLGQMGSADPRKMDEKLTSENIQKEQFSEYIESNQGRQV